MIFVLPFLSLLIASPVDFLSRIYLQVTSLYTQLRPKPRPPFTWGAATVSLWSPEATLALCLQFLWDLAVRMLLLRQKSDLVIHLNALMAPQHTVDETETL